MRKTVRIGKFIVIDGGEGSGKGTIISHLTNVFQGEPVVFSREPGGCEVSEQIRTLLLSPRPMDMLSELMLFEAARLEHLKQFVIPSLERGQNVVCDRFDSSTYAYQICGRGKQVYKDVFMQLNDMVVTRKPDLYVFCDIEPSVALQRRMNAGDVNRFDQEAMEFHERVYAGYQEFFANISHGNVVRVNSALPIEEMKISAERLIRAELGI